jgi:hypothetical protein
LSISAVGYIKLKNMKIRRRSPLGHTCGSTPLDAV